jgi:hypothetical protein
MFNSTPWDFFSAPIDSPLICPSFHYAVFRNFPEEAFQANMVAFTVGLYARNAKFSATGTGCSF